jgi:dimethylargininase
LKPDCIFKKAIVRIPCKNMVHGITTADLGQPDYKLALIQHEQYIEALKDCGLEVVALPPDETYPDSTFVEDTALLIPECAIITNPGAVSRKGEVVSIENALGEFYNKIEHVRPPGTVDGGDILMVRYHYYIGLSDRTNVDGAKQIIGILKKYGKKASMIQVKKILHLKSAIAYLGEGHLMMSRSFQHGMIFKEFIAICVNEEESYAANCVRINGKVIFPEGFPKAKALVENYGFSTVCVDVSEFRKLDGGVSCLSLRF